MKTKTDRFWKYFFAACAALIIGGGATAYGIIQYVAPQQLPAIVLPNAHALDNVDTQIPTLAVSTTSPYFFTESVPLGFDYWAWGGSANWRTDSHYFDGTHGLAFTTTEDWGGVGIEGPGTVTRGYNGVSLAFFAQAGVDNLYVEIHDKNDQLIGRQSVGWYFPNHTLPTGSWQQVTIPLLNFGGYVPATVGTISIIARAPSTVYLDAIKLVSNATPTERWIEQTVTGGPEAPTVSQLLSQATPLPLPYNITFTPLSAGLWYAPNGTFRFSAQEALLGLTPQETYSATILLGGRGWQNYRMDTTVDWGTPTTFTLLARYVDETNYASCAYSAYGAFAQIYQVINGESVMLAQAPELPVPNIDQWKNVQHAVAVEGNRIHCYLNGEKVLSADLRGSSASGTVGLEAWSRDPGGVPHRIHTLSVTPL